MSKKQRTLLEQLAKQQLNTSDPSERLAAEQSMYTKLVQQRADDTFELPDLPMLPQRRQHQDLSSSQESEDLG